MTLRTEVMGPHFTKHHVDGLPFSAVFHHFTKPDLGDPHDHPWGFTSHVLQGSYMEEVFNLDGTSTMFYHQPGDSFTIPASRIHRITDLPSGYCWTLILPDGPSTRVSGTYQFRSGQAWKRPWNQKDWQEVKD